MYLCLMITIDRERYTRSFIVNTFRACVYLSANVANKLRNCHMSYLVIVLIEHYDGCQYSILFPQPRSHFKMANS